MQSDVSTAVAVQVPALGVEALKQELRDTQRRESATAEVLRIISRSQAVIANENTRLFEEVQARTAELSRSVAELESLGQVSRAVNSSLDVKTVLNTILRHACEISDTGGGTIYVLKEENNELVLEAGHNMTDEHLDAVRKHPIRRGDPVVGECVDRREAVQVADIAAEDRSYALFGILERTGFKALLAVPLLYQGGAIGALIVRRRRGGAFPLETVNLLQTFAAQSSLAIYNARLFDEIAQKSRELEIASRHKSQFVANMSHELRTPLAAILGYAERMQEGFYGPLSEKAMDSITRIRSNGQHVGLINTVLAIAKIEAGQFSLNNNEYALDSVVETVRVATESLAETKKLSLKTDVAKHLPVGFGDEQRLTQALLNLVGNAIKCTDAGEVSITAAAMICYFTVAVTDTGPGIPHDELKRVFEQFHQIDNSNTKAKGGTGLGLAIAKQIVELHTGRIWVESTLGKGANFEMELPVRAATAKGAA
jgi:signal transduction histidine kinase